MSNGCQGRGPSCLPCTERFVSCVGRPDGNNSYPGQDMTRRYVVCQTGRTVGDGVCSSGYFDPIRRICATRLDSGEVYILNTCTLPFRMSSVLTHKTEHFY